MPNELPEKRENVKMSVRKTTDEGTQLANELYVLMQPTRQKIVKLLRASKGSLYIEQISKEIDEDRRSVSFHLATLAENGFVEGEYNVIEPATKNPGRGRGAKFYKLTPKVNDVLERLNATLQ